MPRIRCFYEDCIFLEKGLCGAPAIELDPDDGCLTYSDDPDDLTKPIASEEDMEEALEDSWEDEGFEEFNDLDADLDSDLDFSEDY